MSPTSYHLLYPAIFETTKVSIFFNIPKLFYNYDFNSASLPYLQHTPYISTRTLIAQYYSATPDRNPTIERMSSFWKDLCSPDPRLFILTTLASTSEEPLIAKNGIFFLWA